MPLIKLWHCFLITSVVRDIIESISEMWNCLKEFDKAHRCILPIHKICGVPCPSYIAGIIKQASPIMQTVLLEASCFAIVISMWIQKGLRAQNWEELFSCVHGLRLGIWLTLHFYLASMSAFIYFKSNILSMRISFKIIATFRASHK